MVRVLGLLWHCWQCYLRPLGLVRSTVYRQGRDREVAGGLLDEGDSADILPERLLNGWIVEPVEWQQDTRDALKECGDVIP